MAAALSLPAWACTSLIAAKGATADNSVMITYAADSHNLYGELYTLPGGTHAPGEMRQIIEWDTNKPLGEIPQAPVTYTRVGNMNEHGLAITESTWGGREELAGSGIIDYGSLIFLGLERAKTAREAIRIMTDLVKEYGYASSGESFSIADPDEAWILELIGKGKDDKGAVWVARRIPDGYISGHANHPRIHKFPLKDKAKETIYSPDVIKFARQKGYFNGKDEDFDFSRAYAVTDFGALRGCDARVWAYFNKFAPGMEEYLPWIDSAAGEPMPLWVKPSRPLTDNDLKWMMRDHYEGTPYDMTTDVGAGPYKVPYRWRPMTFSVDSVEYTHERAIATQQTGFSLNAGPALVRHRRRQHLRLPPNFLLRDQSPGPARQRRHQHLLLGFKLLGKQRCGKPGLQPLLSDDSRHTPRADGPRGLYRHRRARRHRTAP